MKCCENECTPQGMRIYRGEVTSQYKKYLSPVPVGLRGFSDGLVTDITRHLVKIEVTIFYHCQVGEQRQGFRFPFQKQIEPRRNNCLWNKEALFLPDS
jgi:hypothetical protein